MRQECMAVCGLMEIVCIDSKNIVGGFQGVGKKEIDPDFKNVPRKNIDPRCQCQ